MLTVDRGMYKLVFRVVVQEPNEFVITGSKSFHCGVNNGLTVNEAINFGYHEWFSVFVENNRLKAQMENGLRLIDDCLKIV
jgi:hypothetical protein